MLGLRLNVAKHFAKRIWEATKNFITSSGDIYRVSDGSGGYDIFNVQ